MQDKILEIIEQINDLHAEDPDQVKRVATNALRGFAARLRGENVSTTPSECETITRELERYAEHWEEWAEVEVKCSVLRRAAALLRERAEPTNLGADSPWPLSEVLTRLADAADHLLRDHDCDTYGWEGITVARDAARRYAAQLTGLKRAEPPQPQCTCLWTNMEGYLNIGGKCPVHSDPPKAEVS